MESFDPVFIVGVQRSGTTFLRLLLNRHPDMFIPFETNFLHVLKVFENTDFSSFSEKKNLMQKILDEPLTAKGEIEFNAYDKLNAVKNPTELIDILFQENCQRAGKVRWGVKTPHYVFKMHQILHLYPNAKIVTMTRDPRDIYLSHKEISWGVRDPTKMAYVWNLAEHSIDMITTLFPSNILSVRYEDLIQSTEAEVRKICQFIQCTFDNSLLDFSTNQNAMPDDSMLWHQKSLQGPDVNKIFAWKKELSKYEKAVFANICSETLEKWSYCSHKIRFNVAEKFVNRLRNVIL